MDNLFSREIFRNDQVSLKINQCEIGDVGCVVWDAAIVLAKYLETADFDFGKTWTSSRVVELGAGTGVVGLMCASLGWVKRYTSCLSNYCAETYVSKPM